MQAKRGVGLFSSPAATCSLPLAIRDRNLSAAAEDSHASSMQCCANHTGGTNSNIGIVLAYPTCTYQAKALHGPLMLRIFIIFLHTCMRRSPLQTMQAYLSINHHGHRHLPVSHPYSISPSHRLLLKDTTVERRRQNACKNPYIQPILPFMCRHLVPV